jgi:subtilisin family serine protease
VHLLAVQLFRLAILLGMSRQSFLCVVLGLVSVSALQLRLGAPSHIVILKDNLVDPLIDLDRLTALAGVTVKHRYTSGAVTGFSATLTSIAVALLSGDVAVSQISLNSAMLIQQGLAENRFSLQTGDSVPKNVKRIGAFKDNSVFKAATSSVAVLDTGVDLGHPDLNIGDSYNCVNPGACAQDDNGHGTHVAGIIGSRNQGVGTVGVAPGTKIVAIKVADSNGYVDFADAICGIDYIARRRFDWDEEEVRVATMSFGGPGTDDGNCGLTNGDALHQAICGAISRRNILFVAAAGNTASSFSGMVPASYSEVLTVTGMVDTDGAAGSHGPLPACTIGDLDDRAATFLSSYATENKDKLHTVSAPSLCVQSTWLNGGYATSSGTSMAAPHAAALAAICLGTDYRTRARTGTCHGHTPAWIINYLVTQFKNHADAHPEDGFSGDPNHTFLSGAPFGAYYGHLVWAGLL